MNRRRAPNKIPTIRCFPLDPGIRGGGGLHGGASVRRRAGVVAAAFDGKVDDISFSATLPGVARARVDNNTKRLIDAAVFAVVKEGSDEFRAVRVSPIVRVPVNPPNNYEIVDFKWELPYDFESLRVWWTAVPPGASGKPVPGCWTEMRFARRDMSSMGLNSRVVGPSLSARLKIKAERAYDSAAQSASRAKERFRRFVGFKPTEPDGKTTKGVPSVEIVEVFNVDPGCCDQHLEAIGKTPGACRPKIRVAPLPPRPPRPYGFAPAPPSFRRSSIPPPPPPEDELGPAPPSLSTAFGATGVTAPSDIPAVPYQRPGGRARRAGRSQPPHIAPTSANRSHCGFGRPPTGIVPLRFGAEPFRTKPWYFGHR